MTSVSTVSGAENTSIIGKTFSHSETSQVKRIHEKKRLLCREADIGDPSTNITNGSIGERQPCRNRGRDKKSARDAAI
jgi:hypothetical protein